MIPAGTLIASKMRSSSPPLHPNIPNIERITFVLSSMCARGLAFESAAHFAVYRRIKRRFLSDAKAEIHTKPQCQK